MSWLLFDKDDKPLILIVGNVTKYDVKGISPDEYIELMIKPSNKANDSLINKSYYFDNNETFRRTRFEKMGGGLGALVTLKIDSLELNNNGLELHSLLFKGEEFIDQDLKNKLKRKNQWAAFVAAIMALSMGFGLFKLVGMIKFK